MSNQYGLYELGYTRATKVTTIRNKGVNLSKSLKVVSVRIVFCNSKI